MTDGDFSIDTPCELQPGDRVSHPIFGFGTVIGTPKVVQGGYVENGQGYIQEQWEVPVDFDGREKPSRIALSGRPGSTGSLEKVASEKSRGIHYWRAQWEALVRRVNALRKTTEPLLQNSFRCDEDDKSSLATQLQELRKAESELEEFLEAQARGDHA